MVAVTVSPIKALPPIPIPPAIVIAPVLVDTDAVFAVTINPVTCNELPTDPNGAVPMLIVCGDTYILPNGLVGLPKLDAVEFGIIDPAIEILPPIPTPPATTNAPLVDVVLGVVLLIVIIPGPNPYAVTAVVTNVPVLNA